MAIDPAILDTLAFSGLDEATFKQRALASRPGLALFDHDKCFIRYRLHGADKAKPTLAFLPDGPATIESYDRLIATLEDRFNIAIFEIPGFGFSYPKSPKALEFESSCQILAELLSSLDLGRVVLVGPCIQGLFAARISELLGEQLAGVIIAQTGDFEAERKWIYEGMGGALLAVPFEGQIGFRLQREKISVDYWIPYSAGPHAPVETLQKEARAIQQCGCAYALASQVQKLAVFPQVIDVRIPAAILWGLADKSHAKTDRQSVRRYAPQAQYEEYDEVGHFIDIEAPEKIAEVALSLLS
ncbi:MAG: alpha/beta hydrolase [Sphingopyxis sp.]|nr:alpha/beta hydrolase [Sphingopyxis sp.]